MRMILASASPRRKELMKQIGLDFEVEVSETDETVAPGLEAWEAVEELSFRKAAAVREKLGRPEALIVGADTVVACDGRILGKPVTQEKAVEMLKVLQNREHFVYTGVTILEPDGCRTTFHEGTKVSFAPMSEAEIREYAATGDPLDKAGAYGIQGFCARYIKGIQGDYNNVVGLPVGRLYQELARMRRKRAPKMAVVFDLDGTLSDSIASIQYSGNACLAEFGYGPFEEEDYKYFVGDGAANLVKRALLASGDRELIDFEAVFQRYKEIFAQHCMDGVTPYEGIPELLRELRKRGIRLAVLSNKPHAESVRVVETLFGKGVFDVIQGQKEDIPIKPSPAGVFQILDRLSESFGEEIRPENLLYLGDTGTDVRTGRSAGAFTVGVLWGFRKREELENSGADALISHPAELLRMGF